MKFELQRMKKANNLLEGNKTMNFDQLILLLNSDLLVLIIGSGIGWLFLELVWKPYKQQEFNERHKKAARDEVEFRLFFIESHYKTYINLGNEIRGGMSASSLDPAYKDSTMAGLIFTGWSPGVLRQCYPYFAAIETSTKQELENSLEKQKEFLEVLQCIRFELGFTEKS